MRRSTIIGCFLGVLSNSGLADPPLTRAIPEPQEYHGTKVTDAYRWLENGDDPEVRKWVDAQTAHARGVLDALPGSDKIRTRVTEILTERTRSHTGLIYRPGKLFAIKRQPPLAQPFLVVMPSPNESDAARVLVDPNVIDALGTTAIDWYVPSPDGNLVAVSLSKRGSESGDLYIYDTRTRKVIHEMIPRVNGGTAGGDLAWEANATGFYYTRYPRDGERAPEDMSFYQQVYHHTLGIPADKDRYELGKELPRIAEIQLDVHTKTGRLLATAQNGDSGEFAHYLRTPQGKWHQLSRFGDRIVQAEFGPDGRLYLVSLRDAPRGRILRLESESLDADNAAVVVPESQHTIETSFMGPSSLAVTDSRLYVTYQIGGPSEIRAFSHDGRPADSPQQPPVSSVYGITHLGRDDIIFGATSFITPPALYFFDAVAAMTEKTKLVSESEFSFDDCRVERELAVSKDGTKVPVSIIMPKGARRDGSNPCVVTGYGGFGVSISPTFSAVRRVLLDHGVLYAVANLRGGGEFGEDWHRAGRLLNKQNVFDDFAAVLQHLIDRKYTSPSKLAVMGGSNGGLLMGAMISQHPELIKAVVSYVGIYDMLRVELSPNGSFNVPEFGTVKDQEQFRALFAYSPYHNIRDGSAYPAALLLTGANDPRVDPMQSRKMTARLQAATSSKAPILLRTSDGTGHGGDTSLGERIEETVDVYAFILAQLGVEARSAPRTSVR